MESYIKAFFDSDKFELIAIVGNTGGGKTSFSSAVSQEIFKDKLRFAKALYYVDSLKAKGFKSLKVPSTLVHADYGLYGFTDKKKLEKISSIFVSGWDLGTPVNYKYIALVCPFGVVFLDEPSRYYDNRAFQDFPEFVQQLYQLHRHYKLTLVLMYQDIEDIDVKIRKKFHRIIKMQSIDIKTRRGRCRKAIWNYYEYRQFGGKNAYQWASDEKLIPLTTKRKKELWRITHSLKNYIPFKWFISTDTKRYLDEKKYELYISQSAENCFYKYKGDLAEIYDTDFMESTYYNNPGITDEKEYKDFAKNLKYVDEKTFRKPKNLKEYFEFNQRVIVQRPEDFVRNKTGQELLRKRIDAKKKELLELQELEKSMNKNLK